MCANCVSKADIVIASAGFAGWILKGPAEDALIAAGLLPERRPLAKEMRVVNFLRDLELDPAPILGTEVVEAVDVAQAYPRQKVYRRTFREAIALFVPGAIRSQRVFATK